MSSAPKFFDRVQETSTTTGTGAYTLAGAVTGFQAFAAVGDGKSCYYCAQAVDADRRRQRVLPWAPALIAPPCGG